MATCAELDQDVKNAEAAYNAKKAEVDDLAAALKKRTDDYNPINNPSAAELAALEALRAQLATLLAQLEAAGKARLAAEQKFNANFNLCGKPQGCTGANSVKDMLQIEVPPQVSDASKLKAEKDAKIAEKTKLTTEKEKEQACLDAKDTVISTDSADFAWGPPSQQYPTFASYQEGLSAGVSNDPCVPDAAKQEMKTILETTKNWGSRALTGGGFRRTLKKTGPNVVRDYNAIIGTIRRAKEKRIREINDRIAVLEAEIQKLIDDIAIYEDPNSAKNKKIQGELVLLLEKVKNACVANAKYTYSINITAEAGPGAFGSGGGGVSNKTPITNSSMIKFNNGQFSLEPTPADISAALGANGGDCKDPDAYWLYPVNISANITISNIQDITKCIYSSASGGLSTGGVSTTLPNTLPGNPPATITNTQSNITLTGCLGDPNKK